MSEVERIETETLDVIFGGEFEDGSEGNAPIRNSRPISDTKEEDANTDFTGTLLIEDDRVWLVSGGIKAEVFASEEIPSSQNSTLDEERRRAVSIFRDYRNQNVTLKGVQREEFILRARMATMRAGKNNPSKLTSETAEAFARISQIIEENREQFYQNKDVVSVRPGFRFAQGWITKEPAIVVSVHRKLAPAFLEKGEMLPPAVRGFPVDVKPASPLESLSARNDEDSKEMAKIVASAEMAGLYFSSADGFGRERGSEEESFESITEAVSDIGYREPSDIRLDEVTGAMTVTCHVSPDAGWTTLRRFLDNTSNRLTIAMYDLTAPHIVRRLRSAMSHASGVFRLILGPHESIGGGTKADDLPESTVVTRLENALRQRFEHIFAVVSGRKRVFANSYHIKVAVRDGNAFWLSSGNWQSSNQPDLEPLGADASVPGILRTYNRDWHVVIEHAGLARMFERYIEWDMQLASEAGEESAPEAAGSTLPDLLVPESSIALETEEREIERPRYFTPARFTFTSQRPLRVQPLLTPDNYADHVLRHIRSAREKLYFQNQSIAILENNQPKFDELLDALLEKANTIDDVKIILRSEYGGREMIESLAARGFDPAIIKLQAKCHTKGIIVDSESVLIGSHNWTNSGTLYNRDASLIFHDSEIAKYYEEIFLHDWERLARQRIDEESTPVLAFEEESIPAGMVRVPWRTYFEDIG